MTNPIAIPKGCTERPWFAGKVQVGDFDLEFVTIGEREADSHYEDTICEVWGTEHNAEANAALIVMSVNELQNNYKEGGATKEVTRLRSCLRSCRIMLRNGCGHAEVIGKIGQYLGEDKNDAV